MGRHDDYAHFMHITKQMKFRPPKPDNLALNSRHQPPQTSVNRKTTAYNRYLGHGKGV